MIEMKYFDEFGNEVTLMVGNLRNRLEVAEQVIETLKEKLKKPQTAKKRNPSD